MKPRHQKLILLLIFIAVLISLVNATTQVIDVYYKSTNNTADFRTIDFSSFLLRIHTESNAICKYSTTDGVNYNDMSGSLDYTYGTTHEKSFLNINDGLYKYYIKCINLLINNSVEPASYELDLRIDSLVHADIILTPNSPIKSGKVSVSLVTSKPVPQNPALSYSYDGIFYNKVSLFGTDNNWQGYFVVPVDSGEEVGSFKFSATDLEGRSGEEIDSGGVFIVDTIKPRLISYLTAIGNDGQIKLDWHSDEDLKNYKIYRSNSPNVDFNNYYKTVSDSPFLDNMVERGKTYYYKVSGVDDALNEGDLSREVYATALLDNSSIQNGLDPSLRGNVDNFIVDLDSLVSDIDTVISSIPSKSDNEKSIFTYLGLNKDLDNAKSQLASLRSDVMNYKNQDLTKDELTSKLDTASVKLNVIKKSVPESITIDTQDSRNENIQSADIDSALLQIKPDITDKEKQIDIRDSLKLIKDSKLAIKSSFYICEINYMDGTKKDVSIVNRDITSELEKSENTTFVEIIPKDIVASASDIDVFNSDFIVLKDDPIISFGADNKKIFYSFDKKSELTSLKNIKIVLVSLKDTSNGSGSSITGYFLYDITNPGYLGLTIGAIVLILLLVYFFYIRKRKPSEALLKIDEEIDDALNFLKKEEVEKSEKLYGSISDSYKNLTIKEKKKVYPIVEEIKNKIYLHKINDGLKKLETNKDRESFKNIKNMYDELTTDSKKEVSKSFDSIKTYFENVN